MFSKNKIHITSDELNLHLQLDEILYLKLGYYGIRDDVELLLKGWSWSDGVSKLSIKTSEDAYKVYFLREKESDGDNLFEYTKIMDAHNVKYKFRINNKIYKSKGNS